MNVCLYLWIFVFRYPPFDFNIAALFVNIIYDFINNKKNY